MASGATVAETRQFYDEFEADMLRLGRYVDQHYRSPFEVDGEVITNVQMMALCMWMKKKEREAERARSLDAAAAGWIRQFEKWKPETEEETGA